MIKLFLTHFLNLGWHHGAPIYQLTEPVRLAVESDHGMVTTHLHPGQRLHLGKPNDNFICRQLLRNDYTAFLATPHQHVIKKMLSSKFYPYDYQLPKYLSSLAYDGKPWVIFLNSNKIELSSRSFEKVRLISVGTSNVWQFDALTSNLSSDEEVDVDFTDEPLSAPPPFYQSLCVGPEYPKPYPTLYSFPPVYSLQPGLGAFSTADLTPSLANPYSG